MYICIDWGQHISDVTSEATKTPGFLSQNLTFLTLLHNGKIMFSDENVAKKIFFFQKCQKKSFG